MVLYEKIFDVMFTDSDIDVGLCSGLIWPDCLLPFFTGIDL